MREALDVVPVEDAMAVSGNTEKRALLLGQLKKSLDENYKILLAAERDEDSESAHHVAAAKMEIYRLHQARWLECRRDYEKDPDDPDTYHTACKVLAEMLESGVLSPREQSAYQKRLCGIVQKQIDAGEGEVSQKEYRDYLNALVELGRPGRRFPGLQHAWGTFRKHPGPGAGVYGDRAGRGRAEAQGVDTGGPRRRVLRGDL